MATIHDRVPGAADGAGESDDIERIRELLFGEHLRAFDARLSALERRIETGLSELRESSERRLAEVAAAHAAEREQRAIETALSETRHTELRGELAHERTAREDALQAVRDDSGAADAALIARVRALQDELARQTELARNQLRDGSRELRAQLQTVHAELVEALQRESARLAHDKVDRDDLAALVAGIAARLGDDG